MDFDSPGMKALLWAFRILPPLMLLPLAFLPPSFSTLPFWAVAALVGLVSLAQIVNTQFNWMFSGSYVNDDMRLVRPVLTIVVLVLALFVAIDSRKSAEAKLTQTAQSAQGLCQHQRACPRSLRGWQYDQEARLSKTSVGIAKDELIYVVNRNRTEFVAFLKTGVGYAAIFFGGVTLTLEPLTCEDTNAQGRKRTDFQKDMIAIACK